MSPPALRRYRAERLLEQEFEGLRARVLGAVRSRLRASGVQGELVDVDACYAIAWQGLYTATLEDQPINNPAGWLAVVTFRRALDEHRSRASERPAGDWVQLEAGADQLAIERDLAQELDDRARLRQVFEALKGRLSAQECQAAALCYLQGLPRAEAAARLGISAASMTRLMDGRGAGRPGVSGKVSELLRTIHAGGWCEEQGSLMRGLAFGVLDPDGERHRLAVAHSRECPGCRAYVASLRGLAAVLPPVLLPLGAGTFAGVGAGAGAGAGAGLGAGAGVGGGAGAGAGGVSGGGLATAGGAGTLSASAGAGGGWLLTGGSAGVKLAVGCVLALGLGAGCVTLVSQPPVSHGRGPARRDHRTATAGASHARAVPAAGASLGQAPAAARLLPVATRAPIPTRARAAVADSRRGQSRRAGKRARVRAAAAKRLAGPAAGPAAVAPAEREFGPEHASATEASASIATVHGAGSSARNSAGASGGSSAGTPAGASAGPSAGASADGAGPSTPSAHGHEAAAQSPPSETGPSAASREFGIG